MTDEKMVLVFLIISSDLEITYSTNEVPNLLNACSLDTALLYAYTHILMQLIAKHAEI